MQASYTNKTKIGNWSEEQEQEKHKLDEYLKKREKGLLTTQQLASYSEKVLLTTCKDGHIRDGDLLILCSTFNKGILSLDLGTELPGAPARYGASVAPACLPCARNVFVISRAPGSVADSSVIKYGDKITLTTSPFLKSAAKLPYNKLFLSSQLVTSSVFAKMTHYQEVSFSTELPTAFGNHWQIIYPDPKLRIEAEGTPVQVGSPVILNHCKTNADLGSGSHSYLNDFGTETEVFAHTLLTQHKVEQEENLWAFEDMSLRNV